MIQVFCNKRGSGKTKRLIDLANNQLKSAKGDCVYIDDDARYIRQVDRRIRFIATNDFNIKDYESFYGLICGIISENYDTENIYVDGILSLDLSCKDEIACWFNKLYKLSSKFNINIYMNINYEEEEIPEFIKEFVA